MISVSYQTRWAGNVRVTLMLLKVELLVIIQPDKVVGMLPQMMTAPRYTTRIDEIMRIR